MIVVLDIKTIEIEEDEFWEQKHMTSPVSATEWPAEKVCVEVKTEHVLGRKFEGFDGETICLGATKRVEDALRLPFTVFNEQQSKIEKLNAEILGERLKLKIYKEDLEWERQKLKTCEEELNIIISNSNKNIFKRIWFAYKGKI